ncbi:GIY-YIG nuclease family protein [Aquimarina megaterium]|uniref:GIY-YIG nuclease family protein n=1 Tax=Aquimarina megaterium TaxID=1443666 RepID=UPI0004711CE1|nr:GIY-YIG nuclease family protein [Aquimarina megaterium]
MKYLRYILSNGYPHRDEIIYTLFCENDKFYVGHTSNLFSRMKYGHFGRLSNRLQYLRTNPPLELLFIIRTGITYSDSINIHDLEDYVTVIVSKKYGAENVFGGFRHLKRADKRIKFVEEYDYSANKETIELIDPLIDFELPEINEIIDTLNRKNN